MDTMNFWISSMKDALIETIKVVDCIIMDIEDGVVTRLFLVRNPDKLGAVGAEVGLSR